MGFLARLIDGIRPLENKKQNNDNDFYLEEVKIKFRSIDAPMKALRTFNYNDHTAFTSSKCYDNSDCLVF